MVHFPRDQSGFDNSAMIPPAASLAVQARVSRLGRVIWIVGDEDVALDLIASRKGAVKLVGGVSMIGARSLVTSANLAARAKSVA